MNKAHLKKMADTIESTERFRLEYNACYWIDGVFTQTNGGITAEDLWSNPAAYGNFVGWANACADHDPVGDYDAAAGYMGLSPEGLYQLNVFGHFPSLWMLHHPNYAGPEDVTVADAVTMLRELASGKRKVLG